MRAARAIYEDTLALAREGEAEVMALRPNGHAAPAADPSAPWPEPLPLSDADDAPEPFPLDALPEGPRAAVQEHQAFGQQPEALVACSALAAMSLACQGLVDVRRDAQLVGPVSLALCLVAQSGERKTVADRAFSAAAEGWAKREGQRLAGEIEAAKAAREAHDQEKAGILSSIKEARAGKSKKAPAGMGVMDVLADLKRQLKDHARSLPPIPPYPTPTIEDATAEGIANTLRHTWPSCAWASAEGGTIMGGHGFSDDARTRTLAFINSRWDGSPFDRSRSAEPHTRNHGRRLTVSVMVQPQAFAAFVGAGEAIARGLGTLARFLIAWPMSTMGTRFRDPDEADTREMPALERFLARAGELHRHPLPMGFDLERMAVKVDENGDAPADPLELKPHELRLTATAKRLWIEYLNETEGELLPEGEYADVRDVAAKSAENACRLAGIFHCWEHGPGGSIGAEDMVRGITVARWFLRETRRVLAGAGEDEAAANAELLARWIKGQPEPPTLGRTAKFCPNRLRRKERREAAIALLSERHWLRPETHSEATVLVLNPRLPWKG